LYLLHNLALMDIGFLSRYVVELVDSRNALVLTDEDPEFEFVQRVIDNARLELIEGNMEIANAIRHVGDAINNLASATLASACCTGSGQGEGTGGADGEQGPPTSSVDDGNSPPSGSSFADYAAYLDYKCRVANYLLDDAINTSQVWQNVTWNVLLGEASAATVIAILATTIATPIPGDEILAVLAVIAAWAGLASTLFETLETALLNARNDLICKLYLAGDVEVAITDFNARLDTQIDTDAGSAVEAFAVKQIARIFGSTDNFNRLFEEDTSRTYQPGSFDCSTCFACDPYFATKGSIVFQSGNQVQVSSDDPDTPGVYQVSLWFNTDGSAAPNRTFCGPAVTVDNVTVTDGHAGVIFYDQGGNVLGNYHTDPGNGNLPQPTSNVGHIDVNWNTGQGSVGVATFDLP
jgi:hypothetical protein